MKWQIDFDGRLVLVGYGTVGRPALAMLCQHLDFPLERVTVLDAVDYAADLPCGGQRADFRVARITPDNMTSVMAEVSRPGDLLLNLSVGICSTTLSDWCHRNGVLYVDTALEPWEDILADQRVQPPIERTEYTLHQITRKQAAERWRPDGPTAVLTHGANPGLVSHFAKAALLDVAAAMKLERDPPATRGDWASLAQATGTKVIHISERDTQVSSQPKRPGEFVNTWSIPGFIEEAMMPVEIGWGSHERRLPAGAETYPAGPRNAIFIPRAGANYPLRSWVPLGGQIVGLAIPHNESVTISDYLTVKERGRLVYRPTVVFVYLACDDAMVSLHDCMMQDWAMPSDQRIMADDIVSGRDELGVLLLGHDLTGWWYGSQLDIDEARTLVPGSNPTAVQVAAGALAATAWAMANPARGYCEPEDLPHDFVLEIARPYLGPMASLATDWTPLKNRYGLFDEPWCDPDDPWQFGNFLV